MLQQNRATLILQRWSQIYSGRTEPKSSVDFLPKFPEFYAEWKAPVLACHFMDRSLMQAYRTWKNVVNMQPVKYKGVTLGRGEGYILPLAPARFFIFLTILMYVFTQLNMLEC